MYQVCVMLAQAHKPVLTALVGCGFLTAGLDIDMDTGATLLTAMVTAPVLLLAACLYGVCYHPGW